MENTANLLGKEVAVNRLAEDMSITKKLAGEIYDKMFGYVEETLDLGGKVRLPGVGVLYRGKLEARDYTKPGTTEVVSKGVRYRYKLSAKTFEVEG